jgi:zinc transport system substrate-binding protein
MAGGGSGGGLRPRKSAQLRLYCSSNAINLQEYRNPLAFDYLMASTTQFLTRLFSLLFFAIVFIPSTNAETPKSKPLVYVPVLPYEYVFERIGGDRIEVRTIVGAGDDCHDYSPSPKQLAQISRANLLFSGDLGFEGGFFVKVGDGITAPKAIDLLEGLDLLEGSCEICLEHEDEHEHEKTTESGKKKEAHEADAGHHHDHNHDHEELKDPHVWLSPALLKKQSRRIAAILKEHTPSEADAEIEANLAEFEADLDEVDAELRESLAPLKGQTFYVYHGAFAYFASAYGLEQKAIELTGRQPSPKQVAAIAKQAKQDGVKIIFVQPQFDESSAVSLANTIGGKVQSLDPLERDILANLRKISETIREIR